MFIPHYLSLQIANFVSQNRGIENSFFRAKHENLLGASPQTPFFLLHYSIILMSQTNARQGGGQVTFRLSRGGATLFSREQEGGGRVTFSVIDKFHPAPWSRK